VGRNKKNTNMANNKPTKKYKAQNITVDQWTNTTAEGKNYYTFSIQKAYKDKDEKWQNTDSLHTQDLPKVITLLQQAYQESITKQKEKTNEPEEQ